MDLEQLSNYRKILHQHPELSGEEYETAGRIAKWLKATKPDQLVEGLGGTGIAALFAGKAPGPTIMVRCELDALPISEINEFAYRSIRPNVSHKCGHDGHSTILLGLAQDLAERRPAKGRVMLLFQPAEENGMGAEAVLADPRFAELEPDQVLALHNLPGFPMHSIVCKEGNFTAAVRSILIRLFGKTSHAGEPDLGINPGAAIAEILMATQQMQQPPSAADFAQTTPIFIQMGEKAYGVSAGYGEVHLTLRTWDNAGIERFAQQVEDRVCQIAQRYGLRVDTEWTQLFASNENTPQTVADICHAARELGLSYMECAQPFRWGEDFGLFSAKYHGAMFGLGAGEQTPALHNPDYDFPEEIIPTGINMFRKLIDQHLQ